MTAISFRKISKCYATNLAVDNVSLEVSAGDFCALVGPSGCGKTTLLRIAAGFIQPDSGELRLDGNSVEKLPANKRNVGFVFQNYALFPTKTVAQNIGFSLMLRRTPKKDITSRVDELCEMMHLNGYSNRYPHELSGGQQQRVALARALISQPSILLLDEPLSALDAKIRAQLREEIRGIIERLGITALYVTHDQEEALSIADKVAIMNKGKMLQVGNPMDIYLNPADHFVADFVGTTNNLPCFVEGDGIIKVGDTVLPSLSNGKGLVTGPATLSLRPEHVELLPPTSNSVESEIVPGIQAVLKDISFLGPTVRLTLHTLGQYSLLVDMPTIQWLESPHEKGKPIGWTVKGQLASLFPHSSAKQSCSR